jgi:pimeloyl-ACP methyl ester carboxylesterase/CRP-like cAMP-binding protein
MATFTINGQRIYVREEGPREGQVALLIHGWSSSWYALSPLLPLLNKSFRCLAVDLPGYGKSPAMDQRVTMADYADVLASLLQHVTDSPAVLIGHSMGGMIGLTMELRHPTLIERMVLLCPTISGDLSTYINVVISPITMLERYPVASRVVAALEPYMLNVTDRFMRPASFAERTDISEADYKRLRADARRPGQGRVRAECYWAMREGDLRGKLDGVDAPSLVLWGAEDNTVPLRDAGVVAEEWPSADLRIIPKAGHWPQFETPAITRRYIASFLGLPLVTTQLDEAPGPVDAVGDIAQFLCTTDMGTNLTLAQRTRLAAQCQSQYYGAHELVVGTHDQGNDLHIVKEGTLEVWTRTQQSGQQRLAVLVPGQISGELSVLDGGRRSADVRAGPNGAAVLTLKRERLLALCEDDPVLGNRLLWNIGVALALRLRLTNMRQQMSVETKVPV